MTINQLADLLALQNDRTIYAIVERMVETNPQRATVFDNALFAAFQEQAMKEMQDADYQ